MKTNIVATVKSWNIQNFCKLKEQEKDFNWVLITGKDELTKGQLDPVVGYVSSALTCTP